jgi:hypothetical protein
VCLASINLNKRLGNPAARAKLTAWLRHHHVDVLVAQEPWKPVNRAAINLVGYRPAGGDGDLFCWSSERFTIPPVSRLDSFAQRLELAWLVVYNTYLDCGSTTSRRRQLCRFQEITAVENGRPYSPAEISTSPLAPLTASTTDGPATSTVPQIAHRSLNC